MKIFSFCDPLEPITRFNSTNTQSIHLGQGEGNNHVYYLNFDPSSEIGTHTAGFDQLFLVLSGSGWVSGDDGQRIEIRAGQGTIFKEGQQHAKGSQEGMTVLMIQTKNLADTLE